MEYQCLIRPPQETKVVRGVSQALQAFSFPLSLGFRGLGFRGLRGQGFRVQA